MGIVFRDTFTDTNGVLVQNHTPEVGGRWEFIDSGGGKTAEIASNRAVSTLADLSDPYFNRLMAPEEYDLVATVNVQTAQDVLSSVSLFARFTPNESNPNNPTTYLMQYESDGSPQRWQLYKFVDGIGTQLATSNTLLGVGLHVITVEIRNSHKSVRLNSGVELFSTDNAITGGLVTGFQIGPDGFLTLDQIQAVSAGERLLSVTNNLLVVRQRPKVVSY